MSTGDEGDEGDEERSLSAGFRRSELRGDEGDEGGGEVGKKQFFFPPISPSPYPPILFSCPMPKAQCPMPHAPYPVIEE
nr:hypothetical protein [Nostoc sp. CreGUA01]